MAKWLMHLDGWPWLAAGHCAMSALHDSPVAGGGTPDGREPHASSQVFTDYHEPVLPREVLEYLQPREDKIFLDCTLGGGGHSELLLQAGARVIAVDQDEEALAHARQRLRQYGDRFCAMHSNFSEFPKVLEECGIGPLDGILADLGVSSHQLDEAGRGFSFAKEGPLDMRMNQAAGQTAADLVNHAEPGTLLEILRLYGEERHAKRIVRAIVERREKKPFATTRELAELIESVVPRHGKTHPATQTFQALRLAVNQEMQVLEDFLSLVPRWLKPGGRAVWISFHSGEDRMVKQALARFSTAFLDRPEWPEPRPNPDHCMKLLTRKPLEAAPDEVKRNPRSRSAKLRAAERLAV